MSWFTNMTMGHKLMATRFL